MAGQVGDQAALILAEGHFTGDQQLQVFRLHGRVSGSRIGPHYTRGAHAVRYGAFASWLRIPDTIVGCNLRASRYNSAALICRARYGDPVGPLAMIRREPGQARNGAAAAVISCAGVRLAGLPPIAFSFPLSPILIPRLIR